MITSAKWPLYNTAAELEAAAKDAATLNKRLEAIFKNSEQFALSLLNFDPAFEFDGADFAKKASLLADACQAEYECRCEAEERAAEAAAADAGYLPVADYVRHHDGAAKDVGQ